MSGLKRKDIEKCSGCGKGVAHGGSPQIFRVSVEMFIMNPKKVQSRAGLEAFFGGGQGGAMLAGVMGTDENLYEGIGPAMTGLYCQGCALEGRIFEMSEQIEKKENDKKKAMAE